LSKTGGSSVIALKTLSRVERFTEILLEQVCNLLRNVLCLKRCGATAVLDGVCYRTMDVDKYFFQSFLGQVTNYLILNQGDLSQPR
jgi:hypothetical protein